MTIFVRAKPRSKREFVKQESENVFVVAVKDAAEAGRANAAIAKALAAHFGVAFSQVRLKAGATSRQKIFEIEK
ncbi:MAG: DUF167 family protein [Patescibacteria group bacterium]